MSSKKRSFSGKYGFVGLLDDETAVEVMKKAASYPGNRINFCRLTHASSSFSCIPYLPLYYGVVKDLPDSVVDEILLCMAQIADLGVKSLDFTKLQPAGNHYLDWQVEKNERLQSLHTQALGLADFLADKQTEWNCHSSGGDQARLEALATVFGFPFVKEHWQPHVRVGIFDSIRNLQPTKAEFEGQLAGIAFVKLDEDDSIIRPPIKPKSINYI